MTKWQFTYQVELTCQKHKPLRLYTAFPYTIGLRQKLLALHTDHPVTTSTDLHGNHWLSLENQTLGEHVSLTYEALLEASPIIYRPDALLQEFPAPPEFLQHEPGIESRHPAVTELACQIKATQPLAIVEAAFYLVRRHLQYRLQKKEWGAEFAASQGEGDCTEFASLFAAILRYHNLGARITIGYAGDDVPHAITEVYLGGIWVPMDVTNSPTPIFGLPYDFLTLLRANWMARSSIQQIISFFYQRHKQATHPKLSAKAFLKPVAFPKVVCLDSDHPSGATSLSPVAAGRYPYHIVQEVALAAGLTAGWQAQIVIKQSSYQITITNFQGYDLTGRLLLLGQNIVFETHLCQIARERETQFVFPKDRWHSYWHYCPKLQLVFLDAAEQLRLLGTIQRESRIQLM